jgi:hypothetical protein
MANNEVPVHTVNFPVSKAFKIQILPEGKTLRHDVNQIKVFANG